MESQEKYNQLQLEKLEESKISIQKLLLKINSNVENKALNTINNDDFVNNYKKMISNLKEWMDIFKNINYSKINEIYSTTEKQQEFSDYIIDINIFLDDNKNLCLNLLNDKFLRDTENDNYFNVLKTYKMIRELIDFMTFWQD